MASPTFDGHIPSSRAVTASALGAVLFIGLPWAALEVLARLF